MKKKIISTLLIIAVLLLPGCYTFETIQTDDIDESITDKEILIILHDSRENKFKIDSYLLYSDTLYLFKKKYYAWDKNDTVKIPINEISELQVKQFDTVKTVILSTVVLGLAILIYVGSTSGGFGPGNMSFD